MRGWLRRRDLAAVDAVMQPLDRAAAAVVGAAANQWWSEIAPRIDTYVARAFGPDEPPSLDVAIERYRTR